MELKFAEERMSNEFTKFHVQGLPFHPCLHRFTGPDGLGPHDHPWGFMTFILWGGYVEDVYTITGDTWTVERVYRAPGTSHRVEAEHIHRIVELPMGECYTMVIGDPWKRETRFWDFGEKIRSRAWHEPEFA